MIKNLQALRGAAALLVVCAHVDGLFTLLNVPPFGYSGVDLFFVISGFVMVHTTQADPPTSAQFIKNRIARIVPVYWLMTLIVFAVATFAPMLMKSTTADPVQLLKSLLFIPFKRANGTAQPILFLGWTLNYEMFFYALFALGLACRRYLVGLASVMLVLACLVLLGLTLHPQGTIPQFYTGMRVLEFALGMGAALVTGMAPLCVSNPVKGLVALSLLSCPLIVAGPLVWPKVDMFITAGIPSALLVTGAVLLERWGLSLRSSLLMAIGNASYVLYLSHPYIVLPIQKLALSLHPSPLATLVLIVLCVGVATGIAHVAHILIERPISRAARSLLSTTRLRPQPA